MYAFGVVLFEMLTGKEAVTRTEGNVMKTAERRSLVSIVSFIAHKLFKIESMLRNGFHLPVSPLLVCYVIKKMKNIDFILQLSKIKFMKFLKNVFAFI